MITHKQGKTRRVTTEVSLELQILFPDIASED